MKQDSIIWGREAAQEGAGAEAVFLEGWVASQIPGICTVEKGVALTENWEQMYW